jgi:hypothetical protein
MGAAIGCAAGIGCVGASVGGEVGAFVGGAAGGVAAVCGAGGVASDCAVDVSRVGTLVPGGCDDNTASKTMTAAIMTPGKKYRMSFTVCGCRSSAPRNSHSPRQPSLTWVNAGCAPSLTVLVCSQQKRRGAAVASAVLLC